MKRFKLEALMVEKKKKKRFTWHIFADNALEASEVLERLIDEHAANGTAFYGGEQSVKEEQDGKL